MSRKRKHLDDFELTEDGSYVYRGAFWHWDRPQERDTFLRAAWLLTAVAATCLIAAGFVPVSALGRAVLTLVPYAVAVVFLALETASLLRLTRGGDPLRDHVYQASIPTWGAKLAVALVAANAGGIGALINVALSDASPRAAFPFAAFMLGAGLCLAQLARRVGRLRFTKR